jgi:hypothetical protein
MPLYNSLESVLSVWPDMLDFLMHANHSELRDLHLGYSIFKLYRKMQYCTSSLDDGWYSNLLHAGWFVASPSGGKIFRTCPGRPQGTHNLVYNG